MPDFDAEALLRNDAREEVWRVENARDAGHAKRIAIDIAEREGGAFLVGRVAPARVKNVQRVLRPIDVDRGIHTPVEPPHPRASAQAEHIASTFNAQRTADALERIARSPLVRRPVRTIANGVFLGWLTILLFVFALWTLAALLGIAVGLGATR